MRSLLSGTPANPIEADAVPSIKDGELVQYSIGAIAAFAAPSAAGIVNYIPLATGNTNNLNSFVTDPNGQVWYISRDGKGIPFSGGGNAQLGKDYPFGKVYESSFPSLTGIESFNGGLIAAQGANVRVTSSDGQSARGVRLQTVHTVGKRYFVEVRIAEIQAGKTASIYPAWGAQLLQTVDVAGTYVYEYVAGSIANNKLVVSTNGWVDLASVRLYELNDERLVPTQLDIVSSALDVKQSLFYNEIGGVWRWAGELDSEIAWQTGIAPSVKADGSLHFIASTGGPTLSLGARSRYDGAGLFRIRMNVTFISGTVDVYTSFPDPFYGTSKEISAAGAYDFVLERFEDTTNAFFDRLNIRSRAALSMTISNLSVTKLASSELNEVLEDGLGLLYRYNGSNKGLTTFGGGAFSVANQLTFEAFDDGDMLCVGDPAIYDGVQRMRVRVGISSMTASTSLQVFANWVSPGTVQLDAPGEYQFTLIKTADINNNNLNRVLFKSSSTSGMTVVFDYIYIYTDVAIDVGTQLGQGHTGDATSGVRIGDNIHVSNLLRPLLIGDNIDATLQPGAPNGAGAGHSETVHIGDHGRTTRWRGTSFGHKAYQEGQSGITIGTYSFNSATHGVNIGRGSILMEAAHHGGVNLGTGDGIHLGNGWAHKFPNPWAPDGPFILDITPSNKTAHYYGFDAHDARENPSSFNVAGGNSALAAGRGSGIAHGGRAGLKVAPAAAGTGQNTPNPLVWAFWADSQPQSDGTCLFLVDQSSGTAHRVLLGEEGTGPGGAGKALYIA